MWLHVHARTCRMSSAKSTGIYTGILFVPTELIRPMYKLFERYTTALSNSRTFSQSELTLHGQTLQSSGHNVGDRANTLERVRYGHWSKLVDLFATADRNIKPASRLTSTKSRG